MGGLAMATRDDWIDPVGQLVDAENEGGAEGRRKASKILAQDFMTITRADGRVEDRGALLDAIEKHANKNHRRLNRERWDVREFGDAAVVTSVVTMHKTKDTEEVLGTYRNIHVFHGKVEGVGLCVAWQVT